MNFSKYSIVKCSNSLWVSHSQTQDNVPVCPELPERVHIGEIPEEDEHLETVDEMGQVCEIAA